MIEEMRRARRAAEEAVSAAVIAARNDILGQHPGIREEAIPGVVSRLPVDAYIHPGVVIAGLELASGGRDVLLRHLSQVSGDEGPPGSALWAVAEGAFRELVARSLARKRRTQRFCARCGNPRPGDGARCRECEYPLDEPEAAVYGDGWRDR